MTDIPQPASNPYDVGDHVRIYLDPTDPDAQYHDTVCEITELLVDELDTETGRPLDAYSYHVQPLDADQQLPVSFRHRDLVPIDLESNLDEESQ